MKFNLGLILIGALAATVANADTVTGTGTFWNLGTQISQGTPGAGCVGYANCTTVGNPYFLNPSNDGPGLSAYNLLTSQGLINANSNVFLANSDSAGSAATIPTSFNFVRQAGALTISLIYANSSTNNGAEIGLYNQTDISGVNPANHTVLQAGGLVNLNGTNFGAPVTLGSFAGGSPYANWGVYVRTCSGGVPATPTGCGAAGGTVVQYTETNTGNLSIPTLDFGHQHWAIFQSAQNANTYYLALEDFAFGSNGPTSFNSPNEGYGDYNDLIFAINTSQTGTPEPTTLSIVGLGLVGLAAFGRRFKK
jgi:PEP-CTERM motif